MPSIFALRGPSSARYRFGQNRFGVLEGARWILWGRVSRTRLQIRPKSRSLVSFWAMRQGIEQIIQCVANAKVIYGNEALPAPQALYTCIAPSLRISTPSSQRSSPWRASPLTPRVSPSGSTPPQCSVAPRWLVGVSIESPGNSDSAKRFVSEVPLSQINITSHRQMGLFPPTQGRNMYIARTYTVEPPPNGAQVLLYGKPTRFRLLPLPPRREPGLQPEDVNASLRRQSWFANQCVSPPRLKGRFISQKQAVPPNRIPMFRGEKIGRLVSRLRSS